jgi:PEP-CTERM motif
MMFKKAILGALLATSLMAPATGHAAQVIKKYKLTANFGAGAPAAVRNIVFGLNFDNSANITETTNGLTIFSSDVAPGLKFAYAAGFDILSLTNGGAQPGGCSQNAGQFCSFISNVSGPVASSNFALELGNPFNSSADAHFATSVSITELSGAVPEPATWAFMILGFGMVGGAMRSRQRTAVRVAYA